MKERETLTWNACWNQTWLQDANFINQSKSFFSTTTTIHDNCWSYSQNEPKDLYCLDQWHMHLPQLWTLLVKEKKGMSQQLLKCWMGRFGRTPICYLYCSAQLSMFNMEKCYRNKIITIISIAQTTSQEIVTTLAKPSPLPAGTCWDRVCWKS